MKTLKRSLALWLAVVLTAGLLYVPAFGSDTNAEQQEPALTTTEEAVQDDGAVEEAEDISVIEEEAEEASEDEQEDTAVITEDEDEKDDSDDIDDGAAAITEETEEESSEDVEKEESEAALPESGKEDESAEIPEGTTAEETVLPETNDAEGFPVTNSVEDAADAIDLSLGEMLSGTITYDNPKQYYRFVPEESGTFKFYTESSFDTYGTLYQSSTDNCLADDDDSGADNNFSITVDLEAGVEYILEVRTYSTPNEGEEYSYSVCADKSAFLTITFDANGGTFYDGEISRTEKVEKGKTIYSNYGECPEYADGSKAFAGWSLEPNGSAIEDLYVEENTALYATWKAYCKVTFHDSTENIREEYWNDDPDSDLIRNADTYTEKFAEGSSIWWGYNEYLLDQEDGLVFKGWSTEEGGEALNDNIEITGDLDLYAVWKPAVMVTFDANGGSFYYGETTRTEKVEKGRSIDRYYGEYPEYADGLKAFAGWSLDPNGSAIEEDLYVEEDTTLYAAWKPCYMVTFHDSRGNFKEEYWNDDPDSELIRNAEIYSEKYSEGSWIWNYSLDNILNQEDGGVFSGWSTEEGGEAINDGIEITGDLDLYAVWKPAVTITYDANGGSFDGIPFAKQKVEKGSNFDVYYIFSPEYADGSKAFAGWSLEPDGSIIEDDLVVQDDITVYAVWKSYYMVTFHDSRGNFKEEYWDDDPDSELTRNAEIYTEKLTEGCSIWRDYDSYLLNQEDGVMFAGWSTESGGEVINDGIKIIGNLNLYAIWKPAATITFDGNGGTFYDDSSTITCKVEKGSSIYGYYGETPTYSDGTKSFAGWSLEPDGSIIEDGLTVEEDITLYATWKSYYMVTFHDSKGNIREEYWNDDPDSELIRNAEAYTEKFIEGSSIWYDSYEYLLDQEDGVVFKGWSTEENGEPFVDYFEITGDVDLYAVWTSGVRITFDANGGTFYDDNNTLQQNIEKGSSIWNDYGPTPGYPDDSKGFAGWSLKSDGNVFEGSINVQEDITLYAVWVPIYTITLHAGEGKIREDYYDEDLGDYTTRYIDSCIEKVNEGRSIYKNYDSYLVEIDGNREFAGWSLTEGGEPIDGSIEVDRDLDLFATFVTICTVTLHATEGNFIDYYWDDELMEERASYSDTKEVTCWEGYSFGSSEYSYYLEAPDHKTFAGWSTSEGGKSFDDFITVSGDMDLFATWAGLYTITFDPNGGYFHDWQYNDETGEEIYTRLDSYTDEYAEKDILDNWSGRTPVYKGTPRKIFTGWSTTKNGNVLNDEGYTVKGNATLFAVWTDPVIVTLDANGGSFGEHYDIDQDRWIEGSPITSYQRYLKKGYIFDRDDRENLGYISKEGMSFLGWGTSKNGNLIGNDGLVINNSITLYAQWGKPCTVTFDANGGYYWEEDEVTGEEVKVETRTRQYGVGYIISRYDYWCNYKEGYTLAGWSLTKDGVPIGHDGYKITGGETFYAVWVKLGWNKVGSGWMYLKSDYYENYLCENEWLLDGGKWYYFDRDNWMVTGWRKVGGEWYYLKSNGAMAANEWAKDSGGWYWMDGSGKITKNKWIQSGGQWYFLKANGYMAANEWAKDSGGWYWMDGSGKITKNKWIQSGGQWYFLKANGYMAANEWAKDSGGWYWMDGSGKITRSKWIQTGGKWYYLGANGYMVTGTQKIGGKTYRFNSSGVWIQ